MARIEQRVEIDAPVAKVFAFVVSEWEKEMSFFEGIYDWQPGSEKPMGDGFQISYKAKILGVETEIEMEVRDFEENKGWVATSTGGPRTVGEWRFAPKRDGAQFTYILDYQMPMPIVGGILDALLVKRTWVRLIDKSLQNLKAALET
jgi:hypothetical protein